MKKSLLWTFVLILFPCQFLPAQTWESYYHQLYDHDEIEMAQWEEMSELLCDLEQHPFNLNTATPEQLSQLPFLTDEEFWRVGNDRVTPCHQTPATAVFRLLG